MHGLYTTEGALFISAQLSSDAVSATGKVSVLISLWKQHSALWPSTHVNMRRITPGFKKKERKKFRLDSHDLGFICADVSNVVSYKRNF